MTLLRAESLDVAYRRPDGALQPAVIDASFVLEAGESLGIVGESGSGKSTLARALLGHTRPGGVITSGRVCLDDRDIKSLDPEEMRLLRGGRVAFVPQNPLSSLTPHLRAGSQVAEAVRVHRRCGAKEAREIAIELFAATNLPRPAELYHRYPHELSGGQRQRVVIAAALAGNPRLVILDEPTTALDKTTEIQVLELVQALRGRLNAALIYVSHDLNVISEMCERVLVMLSGRIVESGPTARVYHHPARDYTRRLIAAIPRVDAPRAPSPVASSPLREAPLLSAADLGYRYPAQRGLFGWGKGGEAAPALQGLSFAIRRGETVGLVGESGSGKSTAAALVAGLIAPGQGRLDFEGRPLPGLARDRSADTRRRIQMVFQDPLSSLNPRHRVGTILERPLVSFHGLSPASARRRALELLGRVQLDAALIDSYPRQLSGGQQQRVAFARAFAADPDLIVCDEITSALDVSVQAQVLEMVKSLQRDAGTACLFISHDLGVIRRMADRVVVLQAGLVREAGDTDMVFDKPVHDYTRLLLQAATRGYGNLPPAAEITEQDGRAA
ncbi:MAG: ABC transporter ATP-binding protein [Rhodospirillales bacterium]|nr:ABC transporter ATP-binding protein [Rhodospirillales bacterium]